MSNSKDILHLMWIFFRAINDVKEHIKTHAQCVICTFYGYSKKIQHKSCPVGHKKSLKSLFLPKIEIIFNSKIVNYLRLRDWSYIPIRFYP